MADLLQAARQGNGPRVEVAPHVCGLWHVTCFHLACALCTQTRTPLPQACREKEASFRALAAPLASVQCVACTATLRSRGRPLRAASRRPFPRLPHTHGLS
jgi:hypothetical protein